MEIIRHPLRTLLRIKNYDRRVKQTRSRITRHEIHELVYIRIISQNTVLCTVSKWKSYLIVNISRSLKDRDQERKAPGAIFPTG